MPTTQRKCPHLNNFVSRGASPSAVSSNDMEEVPPTASLAEAKNSTLRVMGDDMMSADAWWAVDGYGC